MRKKILYCLKNPTCANLKPFFAIHGSFCEIDMFPLAVFSIQAILRVRKMQLDNYYFLWHSCIFLDRTVAMYCNRKRVGEKERDGIRKGPQGWIWTWDTGSGTAPYVGTLPTRLSASAETHLFLYSFVVVNRPLMGKIIYIFLAYLSYKAMKYSALVLWATFMMLLHHFWSLKSPIYCNYMVNQNLYLSELSLSMPNSSVYSLTFHIIYHIN